MSDYIKLDEPPMWVIQYPQCSACLVDLQIEDDWLCPVCGTSWDRDATDGDAGTLYETWSGETLSGPTLSHEEAGDEGWYRDRLEAHRLLPEFIPEPKRRVRA